MLHPKQADEKKNNFVTTWAFGARCVVLSVLCVCLPNLNVCSLKGGIFHLITVFGIGKSLNEINGLKKYKFN